MADSARSYIEQLRATKALIKFCEEHGRIDLRYLHACQSALEGGDVLKAVEAYGQVPLGGMMRFDDWFPPVIFPHENREYVWAVFEALVERWSRLMAGLAR
jgi:hypothetical protein